MSHVKDNNPLWHAKDRFTGCRWRVGSWGPPRHLQQIFAAVLWLNYCRQAKNAIHWINQYMRTRFFGIRTGRNRFLSACNNSSKLSTKKNDKYFKYLARILRNTILLDTAFNIRNLLTIEWTSFCSLVEILPKRKKPYSINPWSWLNAISFW